MADFLGLSASYVGGSNRANIYVAREGSDRIRFGTSLLKVKADGTSKMTDFEYEQLIKYYKALNKKLRKEKGL